MQDAVAVAIAAAAGLWLAWTIGRRLLAPPCRPPDGPTGSDGFVPLDAVTLPAPKKSGRPEGRPDR